VGLIFAAVIEGTARQPEAISVGRKRSGLIAGGRPVS